MPVPIRPLRGRPRGSRTILRAGVALSLTVLGSLSLATSAANAAPSTSSDTIPMAAVPLFHMTPTGPDAAPSGTTSTSTSTSTSTTAPTAPAAVPTATNNDPGTETPDDTNSTTDDESTASTDTQDATNDTTSDDTSLAMTGTNTLRLIGIAMMLVGIGLGLWWFGGDLKYSVSNALFSNSSKQRF